MEPKSQEATDMISNLPKEVREMILAYLPTKDAGRTSILSTDWRRDWTSIPDLVLHYDDNVEPATAIKLVNQILALHDGPIRKFDLCIMVDHKINCTDDFDRWFNHLSRNGIKELSLQFKKPEYRNFYIPASILLCSSLNSLFLGRDFFVKWLEEIEGFKFLRILTIDALITDDELEKLISNCPMLENLTIRESYGYRAPKINAPNLKKLYISRRLHFIELYAPELIFLCLNMNADKWYLERFWGPLPAIDLNKFFRGVPNLEILELRAEFINNLIGAELDVGKFLLKNLEELWLNLEGLKEESVKFIQPLFHNAPNLQVLHLQIYRLSEDQDYWGSMKGRDFPFHSLEVINLYDIRCNDVNALPFLKFVLGSASKLRKLIIKKFMHDCNGKQEMCLKQKLMSDFHKSSSYLRRELSGSLSFILFVNEGAS